MLARTESGKMREHMRGRDFAHGYDGHTRGARFSISFDLCRRVKISELINT